MSTFTDLEKDAASVDGFVNENGLIPTRRNGPKPSYQYLVDEIRKSRGFRVVGTFADGFTYELFNDVGIDADGNSWIYVGAGAPNKVVTAGTVPSAPDYEQVTFNSLSAINVSNENGGSVQNFIDYATKNIKSISFIFDDAYESVETVVLPLFNSYSASFGAAIPVASLGNPSRLTLDGVKRLNDAGVEILNHATSGDTVSSTSKGVGGFKGEIATCWSALESIGIKTHGFQTPSSILNSLYLPTVKSYSSYAFTKAGSQDVIQRGSDVHGLHRFGVESATEQQCENAVDALNNGDNGAIVFYAHDIAVGDANYDKIVAILDRAASHGIPVLTPFQCVNKSVQSVTSESKNWYEGQLIVNDPTKFKVNSPASISVNPTSYDATVSIPNSGSYLVQQNINFDSQLKDIDSLVNFSALIRDLSGAVSSCKLGIKIYSELDVGGTVLSEVAEEEIKLNNAAVRYFQELRKGLGKSALIYIRLTTTGAGDVLIREPVVRFGNSIRGERFFVEPDVVDTGYGVNTLSIPTQTVTAGAGYQNITPPTEDNELFKNSGDSIVFKRDAVVQVSASLVASGTNVGVGWKGGSVLLSNGTANLNSSPIAGGDDLILGLSTIVLKVSPASAITIRAIASGIDLQVGASSRLTISEI